MCLEPLFPQRSEETDYDSKLARVRDPVLNIMRSDRSKPDSPPNRATARPHYRASWMARCPWIQDQFTGQCVDYYRPRPALVSPAANAELCRRSDFNLPRDTRWLWNRFTKLPQGFEVS